MYIYHMYMKLKSGILVFEWDKGNLDKSRRKHDVTPEEAESVFFDVDALIVPDERHSEKEARQVILGKSDRQRTLFVAFTIRKEKIRIISARRMHRKEVEKYETVKKDTNI